MKRLSIFRFVQKLLLLAFAGIICSCRSIYEENAYELTRGYWEIDYDIILKPTAELPELSGPSEMRVGVIYDDDIEEIIKTKKPLFDISQAEQYTGKIVYVKDRHSLILPLDFPWFVDYYIDLDGNVPEYIPAKLKITVNQHMWDGESVLSKGTRVKVMFLENGSKVIDFCE
ncbi:MAG: hypothetical protein IJQ34_03045 [Kiritimatiellae bacterium]|nr:hypothetical protein [Kiritimatiellia bacterium]